MQVEEYLVGITYNKQYIRGLFLLLFLASLSTLLNAQSFGITCIAKIITKERPSGVLELKSENSIKAEKFSFYIKNGESTKKESLTKGNLKLILSVGINDDTTGRGLKITGYKNNEKIGSTSFISSAKSGHLTALGDFGINFRYSCKCDIDKVKLDD